MTYFLKDGTERVVRFTERPADPYAITDVEWAAATDDSGAIVKPLDIDFDDPATFPFATIDEMGNGERPGKDNYHGNVRIVREFDPETKQPLNESVSEAALDAWGAKGERLYVGVYRGPKTVADGALVAGDEYDYFELIGSRAKTVADEENYMAKDIAATAGGYAVERAALVADAG